jgi:hypothetical protein
MKRCRSIRLRPLCRGYKREQEIVSISYAVMRIFGINSSQDELTAEIEDGYLSYTRRKISRLDLRR